MDRKSIRYIFSGSRNKILICIGIGGPLEQFSRTLGTTALGSKIVHQLQIKFNGIDEIELRRGVHHFPTLAGKIDIKVFLTIDVIASYLSICACQMNLLT